MILWYLTLSTFFLSSSFIAYAWITLKRKDHQVLFSILSFIAGLLLLWFGRKVANSFYNWRISRKRQEGTIIDYGTVSWSEQNLGNG
ncbi:hypothetical protein Y032_1050g3495 [Ancylostoma ceylanicum]|uniref:Uncharacterized protein n=1 Tax=Ancylostoma ceylanicum TaxID=53326 RepID=A0A016W744_9BILA|nr:hypothetical protein Y032_1050g3495 [Ancylostoma ceylanicum]